MRNFVLQNTMGTATYHATEVMKTLRVAEPGGAFEIEDWSKLELLADVIGEAVEPRDCARTGGGRRRPMTGRRCGVPRAASGRRSARSPTRRDKRPEADAGAAAAGTLADARPSAPGAVREGAPRRSPWRPAAASRLTKTRVRVILNESDCLCAQNVYNAANREAIPMRGLPRTRRRTRDSAQGGRRRRTPTSGTHVTGARLT
jgi:hypothetical protein